MMTPPNSQTPRAGVLTPYELANKLVMDARLRQGSYIDTITSYTQSIRTQCSEESRELYEAAKDVYTLSERDTVHWNRLKTCLAKFQTSEGV